MYVCKNQAKLAVGIGICLAVSASAARAQFGFDSGSDGTDGVLNLAVLAAMDPDPAICPPTCSAAEPCTCEIDLGLAANGTWDTTPGTGDGVYDVVQWAIVFKYTTIDIPAGVTVTFKNHPKNPPVVWLAQGDVTIDGVVSVNGAAGTTDPLGGYAEPGPGGFAGGKKMNLAGFPSGGFGPGGGHIQPTTWGPGGGGGYGLQGASGGGSGASGGVTYGNNQILPLIGGSGGAGGRNTGTTADTSASGGAGGGAILVASTTQIVLGGIIVAQGGAGGDWNYDGGGGSGGGIRLIANLVSGDGLLRAQGGNGHSGGSGGVGRIRIEATERALTNVAIPGWIPSTVMGPVFPPVAALATLTILTVDGETVTPDPDSGIVTVETPFGNAAPVPVVIQATNVPDTTPINVILTPARGDINTAAQEATPPAVVTGGIATAMVMFPPGRNEIQIRANWTNP